MANILLPIGRRWATLKTLQYSRICKPKIWNMRNHEFCVNNSDRLYSGKESKARGIDKSQNCTRTISPLPDQERNKLFSSSNRPSKCGVFHTFCRTFKTSSYYKGQEPWMISDGEVNAMISRLETCGKVEHGIIDRYETNQLASNQPMEDRKFVVKLLHQDAGYLFGVLDGHGGNACAHNVCMRLPDYMALSLLQRHLLMAHPDLMPILVEYLAMTRNEDHSYNYANDPSCRNSLNSYFYELQDVVEACLNVQGRKIATLSSPSRTEVPDLYTALREELVTSTIRNIHSAFIRLDEDILKEAVLEKNINTEESRSKRAFAAANSGACALVAYIQGTDLYIANAGDCRAILGVQSENGGWSAIQLSSDHTAGNPEEVQRIINQHPSEEATTVIHYERLLGRLTPLRAFGDSRFKWEKKTQRKIYSKRTVPPMSEAQHFYTPPYLTAEPEVMSYQLQPTDKFLVLATDGLWDMLSNEDVVHYVQEHLCKNKENNLGGIQPHSISYSQEDVPCDLSNAASCLVREALGGDDHVAVSTTLSIPYPDVRMYRDDITVIVVFFDWDRLETSEPEESS